jgi:glycosyltransferase involved in cell wall biosynthesis
MKILYVHERFGSLGGAESNACVTATELSARGHETALLHGPYTGNGEAAWKRAFSAFFPLDPAAGAKCVKNALRDFGPDVVYVHKMASLEIIETLVLSGLPLVRMVHDHDIYCMRSYKYFYKSREICDRSVSNYCVFPCGGFITRNHGSGFPLKFNSLKNKRKEVQLNQRFDRMLVVTDFMKNELLKNGFDPGRIEIHPPVPRAVKTDLRSSFSDKNLIIYAGQIIRGKGVDILLRALAELKNPFECIILGDGSHRPYCEKLSRTLGLSARVKFEGFVPQEQLQNFYKECTLFALSSVWPEPIATVGLEVMRYGLPVVAFDAGGIKDWLIDGVNGFLVPWMNISAYAQRMDQLLTDKALARQLGEEGLRLVNERYDFDRYITGLETMFHQVIHHKRRSHSSREAAAEPAVAMA